VLREEIDTYQRTLIRIKKGDRGKREERVPNVGIDSDGGQIDGLDEYIELCLGGGVYEAVLGAVRRADADCRYDRDAVKQKLFAVLYGNPRDSDTRVGSAFKGLFPGVWRAVAAINARSDGALARWMQTVESYLVIWRACGRLMREYPGVPLLTIHDCLVTDEAHLDAFERVLLEEFRSVFGVVPKVKRKAFAG
jgi:hypothetical protein